MEKRIIYLILFLSFCFNLLSAQEIEIDTTFTYFSKVFISDTMNIVSYGVVPLEDGGAFVSGGLNASGINPTIYLRKINAIGETEWFKSLDAGPEAKPFLLGSAHIASSDGNFVLSYGKADSLGTYNTYDFVVLKHDIEGNILWLKEYEVEDQRESPYTLTESIDSSGYVIAGIQQQGPPLPVSDVDIRVIKVGVDGEEIWSQVHSLGSNIDSETHSIDATYDGGYILGATHTNNLESDGDPYILKLDQEGEIEWYQGFGTDNYDGYGIVNLLSDSSYLLHSFYNLGSQNAPFYAKFNADGDTLFTKTHYDTNYTSIYKLVESNNQFIGVGLLQEYPPSVPVLISLDENLDTLWTKPFSWNFEEDMVLLDIEKTTDGGFLVNGKSGFGVVPQFSWVSKIDSLGNTCGDLFNCDSVVVEIDTLYNDTTSLVTLKSHHYLYIAPNPIHRIGRVDYDLPKNAPYAWLRIYNLQGLEVRSLRLSTSEQVRELSIPVQMGSGVYPYVVEIDGVQLMEGKLVVN